MKKWILPAILWLLVLAWPGCAWAQETIRVGLGTGFTSAQVRVYSGIYCLIDTATNSVLAEGGGGTVWNVAPLGSVVMVSSPSDNAPVAAAALLVQAQGQPAVFSINGTLYRGDLMVKTSSGGNSLTAINLIDLEQYLYGVVGEEIGYNAPEQALKAQAVACRTYAAARLTAQASASWDVGVGTSTQTYAGFAAESKPGFASVKAAVDATEGQVIYYQGSLIEAYYHSNAGGHTENSENVWYQAKPYLRGVPSPWDEYALTCRPQDPEDWPARTYEWKKTLSLGQLQRAIDDYAAFHPEAKIGNLQEIIPDRTAKDGGSTVSGRATSVILVGEEETVVLPADVARSIFGLNSTCFEISADSRVSVLSAVPGLAVRDAQALVALDGSGNASRLNGESSTFWVEGAGGETRQLSKTGASMIFSGRGYGHGVGMSQWGAWGMAVSGYSYQDILEHYYNQDRKDGRLMIAPLKSSGLLKG